MSLIDLSPLFPYQQQSWKTFTEFAKHLQKKYLDKGLKLWFDGEGSFFIPHDSISNSIHDNIDNEEQFYLFSINNIMYASCLLSSKNNKAFIGIIELNPQFIQSSYYKNISTGYNKRYRVFDASVQIDLKPYDYEHEHKLLFSKADKVDLLFSQHLIYRDNNIIFEVKILPSLKLLIDWQKKVNDINKKMEQILAEKKAKK